jgi:hypothetical protein
MGHDGLCTTELASVLTDSTGTLTYKLTLRVRRHLRLRHTDGPAITTATTGA